LRELRDPSALKPLIAALRDEDAGVRLQAAAALGELGDASAVGPLIATLKDADNNVRWAASFALRDLGGPAVDPLIAALKDSASNVRASAAKALGEIRDPRAVDPLIARLEDSDSIVRSIAASALVDIGTPAADRLLPALRAGDLAAVARAYLFFVGWAEPGSEDVLIRTINGKGTLEMAEVFLNCGNLRLKDAAERWAGAHGYSTVSLPRSGGGAVNWGARR
jgi:HEAT repeat protein